MKTALLGLSCLLLLACGGKGAVDLGGNRSNSGWLDPGASPRTASSGNLPAAAVPQTLYDGGDCVEAIAVDEANFAAVLRDPHTTETRLQLCQLSNCKGTIQTQYTFQRVVDAFPDDTTSEGDDSTGIVTDLILDRGAVIWAIEDHTLGSSIMTCPADACAESTRQLAAATAKSLVADASFVYWIEPGEANGWNVARCARSGCKQPDRAPISDAIVSLFGEYPNFRMAQSESAKVLYFSAGRAIARVPADFSSAPTVFYEDLVKIDGLAVVGDRVMFAVSTLIGAIRTCPTGGSGGAPELLVSAPGWPYDLVADAKGSFWLRIAEGFLGGGDGRIQYTLISFPLASAPSEVTAVAGGRQYPHGCRQTLNSQHLFWCERTSLASYDTSLTKIRMLQR